MCDKGEEKLSLKEIYERDMEWLKKSDLVIAEVSMPSLGIGYELGVAEKLGKRVICFYDFVKGNPLRNWSFLILRKLLHRLPGLSSIQQ